MTGRAARRALRSIERVERGMGLGAVSPNIDKAAIDQLHALAVQIAAARAAGDDAAESALRQQFNSQATVYSGYTAAQLDQAVTQAEADSDPFGLKTAGTAIGQGLFWIAIAAGLYYVAKLRGNRGGRSQF